MLRTLTRSALALLLLATLPACDSNDDNDLDAFAGTYTLATVGGTPVPATFSEDDVSVTFVTGFIRLTNGGSVNISLTVAETDGTLTVEQEETISGTYTVDGSTITMRLEDDGAIDTETGRISGDTITVTDEDGLTYVFRR
jgi:hypothetical protein